MPSTCSPQRTPLVGMGSYADVLRIAEDRVLKKPKIYPEHNSELAYSNHINRGELLNEKAVYKRLGNHHGITRCFKVLDKSIELAFENQGDLEKSIRTKPAPSRESFRRISLFGIFPSTTILPSFATLGTPPYYHWTPMRQFCESDTTPQVEILYAGCVLYSIAAWREFKCDYFEDERFPQREELPPTDGVLFGRVIRKCWAGEYASMEAVRDDVHDIGKEATTSGQYLLN